MSDTGPLIPRLYTAPETAQLLRISARTIWALTKRGQLRAVRLGRCVRYDERDVASFIEGSKQGGRT